MHQQLVNQYADIMASLNTLPGEIAAVQTDLNAAKAQLATSDRTLADIEAQTALNVEGKNAEERKARLTQTLKADPVYVRWAKAADVERADIAKLTTEYDRLTREFAAVGYAARLTASMAEMLAAMGPNKAQDVQFNMDAGGKSAAQIDRVNDSGLQPLPPNLFAHLSNGSNGHMTAQDAAEAGL